MSENLKSNLKQFGWTVMKAVLTGLTVLLGNILGGGFNG